MDREVMLETKPGRNGKSLNNADQIDSEARGEQRMSEGVGESRVDVLYRLWGSRAQDDCIGAGDK